MEPLQLSPFRVACARNPFGLASAMAVERAGSTAVSPHPPTTKADRAQAAPCQSEGNRTPWPESIGACDALPLVLAALLLTVLVATSTPLAAEKVLRIGSTPTGVPFTFLDT